MARFLTTAATTLCLEEIIKKAQKEVIILSPYLKFNKRIRDLLADKTKTQIRIIYGKQDLKKEEKDWLKKFSNITLYFHKNLHAKCYIASGCCIITSMNLYEYSQSNNDEMGVFARKTDDPKLYRDTLEEARRIMRLSEEVSLDLSVKGKDSSEKISTSKLSIKLGMKKSDLENLLMLKGYLAESNMNLTQKGKDVGGELSKYMGKEYLKWPEGFNP